MPLAIVNAVAARCREGDLSAFEKRLVKDRGLSCQQLGEAIAAIAENRKANAETATELDGFLKEMADEAIDQFE